MKTAAGRILGVFMLIAVFAAAGPTEGICSESAGEQEVVRHTVKKGDHLMLLAGYYFKDPRQWRQIYAENTEVISDPNLLIPGTVLNVRPREEWNIPYEEFAARAGY